VLVAVLVGTTVLLSDWIRRTVFYGRGGRRGRIRGGQAAAVLLVIGLVLALLAPLIAQLLRLAISRSREYLADASGALLTRYPEGLASALEKLAADTEPLEAANRATAHLYIVNPLKGETRWETLFDTHPPIAERVRRLRTM
jgi:heat shock protein HtpX